MKRNILRNMLVCLALLVLISGIARPQFFGPIDTLKVSPGQPRPRDPVTLNANGDWGNAFTNLTSGTSITGNTITLTVTISDGLLQVITPWNATASIGTLPRGEYTVVVRLQQFSTGQYVQKSFGFIVKNDRGKGNG